MFYTGSHIRNLQASRFWLGKVLTISSVGIHDCRRAVGMPTMLLARVAGTLCCIHGARTTVSSCVERLTSGGCSSWLSYACFVQECSAEIPLGYKWHAQIVGDDFFHKSLGYSSDPVSHQTLSDRPKFPAISHELQSSIMDTRAILRVGMGFYRLILLWPLNFLLIRTWGLPEIFTVVHTCYLQAVLTVSFLLVLLSVR